MFSFGQGYGFLRGLLTAYRIPFQTVSPSTWQKALGCLTKGDKSVTRRKAQEMFPSVEVTNRNADALLLAWYAKEVWK